MDHIGSSAVPGLVAKPVLDLQVRIRPLPPEAELAALLAPLGYARHRGSRADSPGVNRDIPSPLDTGVPDRVWEKQLYTADDARVILHVRHLDSPWGHDTVAFRDWLTAYPAERARYAEIKVLLSEENRGARDYDDYTRAKGQYFLEVLPRLRLWAQEQSTTYDR